MLTTLRIKNLALVTDLTLELQSGYNAITGETGAGKSVIMGALHLVLGERADRSLIRSGSDTCSVESVFDVSSLKGRHHALLEQNGLEPCEDQQLLLKRTFTTSGTNRQFINGSPTTLGVLSALGELLVDMHGPHDHQSLLYPAKQLLILDAFAGLSEWRGAFAELVRQRAEIEAGKAALIVDEKTYAQQIDLLRHQVNEILSAKLQPGEEESLELEYSKASNAARLLQLTHGALGQLTEEDPSLTSLAGALGRSLQEMVRLDPGAAGVLELHEQSVSLLQDLQRDLSHYADSLEIDPARLEELEERVSLIQALKRKYGSTAADILTFGAEAERRLRVLESRDEEVARLNKALAQLDACLQEKGRELSQQRKKAIPKLCKSVVRQLDDLGFKQSHFEVALHTTPENRTSLSPSGFDVVEFQFAPNPGEAPRPLRGIASSGELSRVMLALKTVLAAEDEIPVLVFDEVDANIGGETAHAVGEKMKQIARNRQVLCITHLAPVAASASAHYVVSKSVEEGRTISSIHQLKDAERVVELARMLGGKSQAARSHAEALLQQ